MSLDDLRDLCARHWNPIGIPMENQIKEEDLGFRPLPKDEYDAYLLHIEKMLAADASFDEIYDYLSIVEQEYLMLSQPHGDKHGFVSALQEAYRAQAHRA